MKMFVAVAIASLFVAGCGDSKSEAPVLESSTSPLTDCSACPDPWARPVCGIDGMTWPSECEATCNEVPVAFPGDCSCDCWNEDDTVCGTDNETYPSTCSAECLGAAPAYPGACICADCPADAYELVCGVDGVTYRNECDAIVCAGVDIEHWGTCDCPCPTDYQPVCGVDAVTYTNQCRLDCAGVPAAHDGACPGDGPLDP